MPHPLPLSDTKNPAADKALVEAAHGGDLPSLMAALARGASPDAKSPEGFTALRVCAESWRDGTAQAMRELIQAGASVDLDGKGSSPLRMAIAKRSLEKAEILIAAGADLEDIHPDEGPLLSFAVLQGFAVQQLLAAGAPVASAGVERRASALPTALRLYFNDDQEELAGEPLKALDAIFTALIAHGADLASTPHGQYALTSSLFYALRDNPAGSAGRVKELISIGADLLGSDPRGLPPARMIENGYHSLKLSPAQIDDLFTAIPEGSLLERKILTGDRPEGFEKSACLDRALLFLSRRRIARQEQAQLAAAACEGSGHHAEESLPSRL